jgi:MFS family permease
MTLDAKPRFSSIISIIFSMSLAALGSGVIFSYVPFTLSKAGYDPWVAGTAVTAVAGGGLIGCLIAGPLIRRVGHARAFACLSALVILSALLVAIGVIPSAWIASRALYGLASNGNFIVVQSWLNHSAANEWRGRAMAMFYLSYVVCLGAGSFAFGFMPGGVENAPLLALGFYTLAILPIGLTILPSPPPPQSVRIDLAAAWRISPVAFVGIFASGGLSMLVQGFTPIYAAGEGLGREQIATLMFLMQLGMIGVQYPLGALSDRIDRRIVLIIACCIIAVSAVVGMAVPFTMFFVAVAVFAVWSGATETIYSISNAHANDRADSGDYVALASTMLVGWSVSAFIMPGAVTAITPILGPKAYMGACIAIAVSFAIFALYRVVATRVSKPKESEHFEIMTSQVPNAENLVSADTGKETR